MAEEGGTGRTRFDSIVHANGQVRPLWRILFYFVLFLFLSVVGQLTISVLPRHPLGWGALIVTTGSALIAGWTLLAYAEGRAPGALGFPLQRSALREAGLGLLLGAALITTTVLLLLLTGAAYFQPAEGTIPDLLRFLGWTFAYFAIAAAWEEAVFRGYPFQVLVLWIGRWPAALLMSGIFAFLHGQNPSVTALALLNIFLAGVLLSFAYLRTRSLWFATGVHLGWNWTMASIFDFPVSGYAFENPLFSGAPEGAAWWTGGAFGPEAGAAGTLVLLMGTLWLLRTERLHPTAETRRLRPIVDSAPASTF